MEDASFAVTVCQFCSLCLQVLGQKWVVSENKGPPWIEEACKELHFPDLGFMTTSHQQVLLPPALTLGVPQPVMPRLEGCHQEWIGGRALPSSNLIFPCPICTTEV